MHFVIFVFKPLSFENAYIVHNRGRCWKELRCFYHAVLWKASKMLKEVTNYELRITITDYGLLGLLFGLIIATKLNGGFLLMPIFILALHKPKLKWAIQALTLFGISTFLIFTLSYFIHFTLTPRVADNRYYETSPGYKAVLNKLTTNYQLPTTIRNFPLMFCEHIQFIFHYEKGVPVYDACKDDENGSLPVTWPMGNKSINYRWEKTGDGVKYLYLQGNPAIWLFGLVSLF
jgi:4-amino-4-deoxy-L-arabinose transferase-like glycosyltransferase